MDVVTLRDEPVTRLNALRDGTKVLHDGMKALRDGVHGIFA